MRIETIASVHSEPEAVFRAVSISVISKQSRAIQNLFPFVWRLFRVNARVVLYVLFPEGEKGIRTWRHQRQ